MGDYTRLVLPEDVAEDLVSDRTAVRPIRLRGGGFAEAVTIAIDAVNTGSAVVSVTVAANTFRRLAQAFVRRRRPADPARVTLTITVGDRTQALEVDLTAPQAQEQLFDFFAAQLHVS